MSTKIEQFKYLIIDPTLKQSGLYSPEASDLLLGTALVESNLDYLKQIGGGPALGYFQMEPATFDDIFFRYLGRDDKKELMYMVNMFLVRQHEGAVLTHPVTQLMTNLPLAVLMARIRYLMVPEPIPESVDGQAAYWKKHYNTVLGAGEEVHYLTKWYEHHK